MPVLPEEEMEGIESPARLGGVVVEPFRVAWDRLRFSRIPRQI